MSARPNHQQNTSKHPGTYCQFSKKYEENVVFITIYDMKSAFQMPVEKINEYLNPFHNEKRIEQITRNWSAIHQTIKDIENKYFSYIYGFYNKRPKTFIFFTTIRSLANASQMFTNYLVAHNLTHEHYRQNPIHQQHWIMKHSIHGANELKYYCDFIDHIYNTGTGQLL